MQPIQILKKDWTILKNRVLRAKKKDTSCAEFRLLPLHQLLAF